MDPLLKTLLEPYDTALRAEVMTHAPMTAVIVDQKHTIVKMLGDRLLKALGYAWPDEVIGQPVEIFVPEPMRANHKVWFDEWIKNPQERSLRDAQTMTVAKKDGTTTQVRISLRPLYIEDGAQIGKEYAGHPFKGGIAYIVADA